MPRGAAERNRGTNEYFGTPARGFRLPKNKSGANRTFLVSPATRDFGRILAIRNHGEHHERRFFMARSSNLSEGMRDLAQEGAEQARRMADFGVFGMRDFAEHSVGQARQAFDGFLSATQRTMATFDQQASDIRQKTSQIPSNSRSGCCRHAAPRSSFSFRPSLPRRRCTPGPTRPGNWVRPSPGRRPMP